MKKIKRRLKKIEGITEIRDSLFFLESLKFPNSNSLLILDEEIVLVDTGSNREILEKIRGDIDRVINTHYHVDHNWGNDLFDRIWINEIESSGLEGPEKYMELGGIFESEARREFKETFLDIETPWTEKISTYPMDGYLDFGDTSWRIIHTPGHSSGHCCFYEERLDVLFAGDYGPEEFGPWYGYPSCSISDFINSVQKIIDLNPSMIISSHTPPISNEISLKMEKYLNTIYERDQIISNQYEDGLDVEEILEKNIFYSKEIKSTPIYNYFAKTMIKKHLKRNGF